ncbi:MAG: hypothetical protein ACYC0W_08060 [Candidatus Nanopelagicales bacterium]
MGAPAVALAPGVYRVPALGGPDRTVAVFTHGPEIRDRPREASRDLLRGKA